MTLFGVDFSSRPAPGSPICVARTEFIGDELRFHSIEALTSWTQFEVFLETPGHWRAGFDFPFGLPRSFVDRLGWPSDWAQLILHVSNMTKDRFVATVRADQSTRPKGQKYEFRVTDRLARSQSPLNVIRPAVGLMFYEGPKRLLAADLDIQPCRPRAGRPSAFEVYPALFARQVLGSRSYKGPAEPSRLEARRQLCQALANRGCKLTAGIVEQAVMDSSGDSLDAAIAAYQVAGAKIIPADPQEGWIVGS